MRFSSSFVSILTVLAAGPILGCGEDPGPVETSNPSTPAPTNDAGSMVVQGTCSVGQTEACTCLSPGASAPLAGTRSCSQGLWLGCSCGQQTITVEEECRAGRYEGDFGGIYSSGFAGGFPIPVVSLDLSGKPGLGFTLLRSDSGGDEFATYTVSDGFVDGVADGVFPFKGKLTGTLDCRTKRFEGTLDGMYSILLPLGLNEGAFIGPVTGVYDPTTHSFTLGTWDVKESEEVVLDILTPAGGKGEWDAKWVGP